MKEVSDSTEGKSVCAQNGTSEVTGSPSDSLVASRGT